MGWFASYVGRVAQRWWVVMVAVLAATIAAVITAFAFNWPWYAWVSIALAGVVVAQAVAAHDADTKAPASVPPVIQAAQLTVHLGPSARTLTGVDTSAFEAQLRAHAGKKVRVTCLLNDPEGYAFATELKGLLERIGWQVLGLDQVIFSAPVQGVRIRVAATDSASVPAWVRLLKESLEGLGFRAQVGLNSRDLPPDLPEVLVGSR